MSERYALKAEKRDRTGKGVARSLRRENKIPAVIYGDHKDPITISLPANDMNAEYTKGHMFNTLCDLEVGGETHLVLARDIQLHPVTDFVLHADFLRVTKKTKIAVDVPVEFINEEKSPALREGAVLDVVRYRVELWCSAMDIPDHITVDLEGAELGDSLKISDAVLPEGTKPVIEDRDFSIATLQMPKKLEEPEPEVSEEDEELAEGEEAAEGEEGAESAEGKGEEGADEAEEDKGE